MKNKVTTTERGWAGHFIGSPNCMYHRNTLVTFGDRQIVVSTVGNYRPGLDRKVETIGWKRYYETMVFEAKEDHGYIEIDVEKEVDFPGVWGICADKPEDLPDTVDTEADKMHERIVKYIKKAIKE